MANENCFLRREKTTSDESVADFVRRHFGQEMVDRVAEPLLAGVYGGNAEHLSVRAVLPRFAEMEREHGSLVRATLKSQSACKKRRRQATAAFYVVEKGHAADGGSAGGCIAAIFHSVAAAKPERCVR